MELHPSENATQVLEARYLHSPKLMNAGGSINQLSACFVLPVADTIEDIFDAVKHMAVVQCSGGGTGFSFSRLRPEGDYISTTGGKASGPISLRA